MPFPVMLSFLDQGFPDGTYNYWKSTFIHKLTDQVIDLLIEHGNRARSPMSGILLALYGGAAGRVGPGDTAFAQRQAQYNVGITAQWTDAAESDTHTRWTRD